MRTLNTTVTKFSLVVAIVVALFCSLTVPLVNLQAQDGKKDELPLYPLKKGLKWKFGDPEDTKVAYTEEVTDVVVINKLVCYEITATSTYYGGEVIRRYIAAKDDGFFLVAIKGVDKAGKDEWAASYEPPVCILKPASKKALSWLNDGRVIDDRDKGGGEQDRSSYKQFSDTISYDGKQVEAVRVTFKQGFYNPPDRVADRDTWYLPGKGPIKIKNLVLVDFSGSVKIGDSAKATPGVVQPDKSLIPSWYKDRLHINLLLLGLFLYPLLWFFIFYVMDFNGFAYESVGKKILGTLVYTASTYIVVTISSLIVWGVSYLVIGFFSENGYYVPWWIASFVLHILVLLFLTLWLASLLLPAAWKIKLPGFAVDKTPSAPVKIRFNYIAMIKALAIMIISALASQFAGWIAGAIVLAFGAGFAMVTSD